MMEVPDRFVSISFVRLSWPFCAPYYLSLMCNCVCFLFYRVRA